MGFKVYLDGSFYQTYPLNPNALMEKKNKPVEPNKPEEQPSESTEAAKEYALYQRPKKKAEMPTVQIEKPKTLPALENAPPLQQPKETVSPEEKTLKDLEY